MFIRYPHLERFGKDEVEGIEVGQCFIFPKLDGTNSQLFSHLCVEDNYTIVRAGSRNRELSINHDNAGFLQWALSKDCFYSFFKENPNLTLYGEWLVPHTLKTYRDDAWRKFWIFDVYDRLSNTFLNYLSYSHILHQYNLDYIEPICVMNNPSENNLIHELNNNTYLIKDGCGAGEGIVIKNYGWSNKFNKQIWAKLVRTEFKEENRRAFGVVEKDGELSNESYLAEKFVTQALVDKTRAKIELDILNSKGIAPDSIDRDTVLRGEKRILIPRLLETVFHDLVGEEILSMIKELKGSNQTIDFKKLRNYSNYFVKQHSTNLF